MSERISDYLFHQMPMEETQMADYAADGKCHNAEPGTFNHECGKPAAWIGTKASGFRSGFCHQCRKSGFEARGFIVWEAA